MLELMVLASPERLQHWLWALLINAVLIALAQRLPLLTRAGWIHAGVLGTLLLGSLDWPGWWAVVLYLALGSLVTRLGFRRKQEQGLAEARGGRRGPENVWGSAATGAALAVLTVLPAAVGDLLRVLLAAAVTAVAATATAVTTSAAMLLRGTSTATAAAPYGPWLVPAARLGMPGLPCGATVTAALASPRAGGWCSASPSSTTSGRSRTRWRTFRTAIRSAPWSMRHSGFSPECCRRAHTLRPSFVR